MSFRIRKEDIFIIVAVVVAIATLTGIMFLLLDDDTPRVTLAPVSSQEIAPSSEGVYVPEIKGNWYRSGVTQEEPATIEISEVNETSFLFQLHARNMTKTGSISGEAYFETDYSSAKFTNVETGAEIIFTLADYTITISHTSTDTALGCDDTVTYDGTYSKDSPSYTDVSSQEVSSSVISVEADNPVSDALYKDLRKEKIIENNIKGLMSDSEYQLFQSVMADENIRDSFPPSEAGIDKDGKRICIDREMNAIKYHAVLSGASTEVLLMCKPQDKVYVAIYEIDEVRYYTNDSEYASKAPASIVTFADSRSAKLKCMS